MDILTKMLNEQLAYQKKTAKSFQTEGKRKYTYMELLDYWYKGMLSQEELRTMKKDSV